MNPAEGERGMRTRTREADEDEDKDGEENEDGRGRARTRRREKRKEEGGGRREEGGGTSGMNSAESTLPVRVLLNLLTPGLEDGERRDDKGRARHVVRGQLPALKQRSSLHDPMHDERDGRQRLSQSASTR
eukprot:763047-Hanusia_phi.AAC.3